MGRGLSLAGFLPGAVTAELLTGSLAGPAQRADAFSTLRMCSCPHWCLSGRCPLAGNSGSQTHFCPVCVMLAVRTMRVLCHSRPGPSSRARVSAPESRLPPGSGLGWGEASLASPGNQIAATGLSPPAPWTEGHAVLISQGRRQERVLISSTRCSLRCLNRLRSPQGLRLSVLLSDGPPASYGKDRLQPRAHCTQQSPAYLSTLPSRLGSV